ncbi:putative leucine-rich repeat-containing, plant-type, leucine-rich repeat domain superfamily [Helianthus annuus]|uniref:Leucine-rich repeat-containing, plant-type, leucine-rich repeat domain superfamily n=1 Tax=Helianthus annuus TaxID=4232 RepID=A0A251UD69_HELAN|nr:putative leucine-rich repeat-containing, plant-type, leucine-rich repeat domain superfamily [Helianthus annuus]KAJ0551455.1 putative leucine-rich repeat-containing, plant-type, leucine-rich repeat domain superfamily [Helianthus annuus]KAJ0558494.1 putative leucine-rich repeat-containing, plant-type, leucine-rich repeat domain superfamily [Helianthus annuus]KAJ0564421.1 putative leucine-rich repeat-containing, plant-type, leucine-rich repeat domain superfamily [Helianthus annuus]KAJ0732484.1 
MRCILVLVLCFFLFMSHGLGLKEDANTSSCIDEERQALLDVKANLIDLHGNLSDWASERVDCCKWAGVTCNNQSGHVIKVDLTFGSTGFTGKSLQVLNQLQSLNLSGINFQANPLTSIFSMSKLQSLDISGANLSGPIPHQLANLSNLLELDLSNNSLSGSIPFSFGNLTFLTYLDLSQNPLEGDIPQSIGNCSSLAHLDLSQNLRNGSMPDSIDQLSKLEYLDVGHNSLNGSIPNFIGCPFLSF